MSHTKETPIVLTWTSPSSAITAAEAIKGAGVLRSADKIVIEADLTTQAATGGTLDVYLQYKVAADTWRDWVHFAQLANNTTKKYTVAITGDGATIVEVGGGSDGTPAPALAAATAVNVIPSGDIRVVSVAGAGTTVGRSQTIRLIPYTQRS